MISRVQRYFLEIKNFTSPIELNLPESHKIILDDNVLHLESLEELDRKTLV